MNFCFEQKKIFFSVYAQMNNINVNFCGMKSEIRKAERVLGGFNKNLCYQSPFLLSLRAERIVEKPQSTTWIEPLQMKIAEMAKSLKGFRSEFKESVLSPNKSLDDLILFYMMRLKALGLMNCGELSNIFQLLFSMNGIKTHQIVFTYSDMPQGLLGLQNHAFLAINIPEKANLLRPKTWGSDSIVVDPLFKFVKPANDGLNEIAYRLGVKKGTKVQVSLGDFVNESVIDNLVERNKNRSLLCKTPVKVIV